MSPDKSEPRVYCSSWIGTGKSPTPFRECPELLPPNTLAVTKRDYDQAVELKDLEIKMLREHRNKLVAEQLGDGYYQHTVDIVKEYDQEIEAAKIQPKSNGGVMSRSLNMFILDEMIEQYDRFNPLPEPDKSFDSHLESELLSGPLKELKILRSRCAIYESKIYGLEKELREKLNPSKEQPNE